MSTQSFKLLHSHIDGILSSTTASVYWKDKASKYLDANNHFLNRSGISTKDELVGTLDHSLVWSDNATALVYNDQRIIEKQQTSVFIERCKIPLAQNVSDLMDVDCISYKSPLLNSDGNLIGLFGMSYPITKELNNVQVLRELDLIAGKQCMEMVKTLLSKGYQAIFKLTSKELACFKLIIKGMTAKRIAQILSLSPRTIEQYIEIIKNKLDCHSKTEIIEKAFDLGLLNTLIL